MIDRTFSPPLGHSFFLFGPRQTGKSTLLRQSVSAILSHQIDLLKSSNFLRYKSNPAIFREEVDALPENVKVVLVDEIQKIPLLLDEVHSIIESSKPRVFILSGSSARKLKRYKANLLAGRAWTFNLYPLTHRELGDKFELDKALSCGTLPAIYLADDDISRDRTLRSYVDTYLQEEIQSEALVRNLGGFFRFLTYSAARNGQIINFAAVSSSIGVSNSAVREFYRILEDTLLGFYLPSFSRSDTKKLVKHPRFYFFDTGVARAILQKHSTPLSRQTEEYGLYFEHFIILECIRLAKYAEKAINFSFYRTGSGMEVDLIAETPDGKLTAIEIKSTDNPVSKHFHGLKSFKNSYSDAKLICACTTPYRRNIGDIAILPWQELFSELGF